MWVRTGEKLSFRSGYFDAFLKHRKFFLAASFDSVFTLDDTLRVSSCFDAAHANR